jgi:two-component system sensor histidine kinase ChiS
MLALDNIRTSSMALLNMVQDVIDLAKLKNDQIEVELSTCSVDDLIEVALDTITPIARSKGLDLRSLIEPDLPPIHVDFHRIYEVLVHLAANAIKFTSEGWIEIGAKLQGEYVRFYVQDTGIGVPKEKGELIFREFRQADNSTQRSFGGLGLGLTLAQRFVELHGGEIGFSSKYNGGSVFFFTIPTETVTRHSLETLQR